MFWFPRPWKVSPAAVLGCVLWLGCGCRPAAPKSEPQRPGLAERLRQRDATVWREEVNAREREMVFVRLADDLRHAEDKLSVLEQFAFEEIAIPRPLGAARTAELGLQVQAFSDESPLMLSLPEWRSALGRFRAGGWSVAQAAWSHERFWPATNGRPARSLFSFVLQGEQPAQTNRFILRGDLLVDWPADSGGLRASRLMVESLSLVERAGPPAFSNHARVAPEPHRPGAQVNMHPLIVNDADADGDVDIVLPGVNQVLVNDGGANFTPSIFISEETFYPVQETGVFADFTGDGHPDYLGVGDMGPMANRLVLYAGGGSLPFRSTAHAAWPEQAQAGAAHDLRAASVITAGDINGDGTLDLFVGQYRPPYADGNLPTPYYDANDGYPSFLLLNDGTGHFTLARRQPALAAKERRRTLAASFVDLDQDGDLDLVTLNDFSGVDLFHNDGKGIFADRTALLPSRHLFGMGHVVADFDADGSADLLAIGMDIPTVRRLEALGLAPPEFPDRTAKRSAMAYGNRLYLHRDGGWIEPAWARALARTGWSWGASAFDIDNDGDLEIYVANGHVSGKSSADYDSYYWTRDIYLDPPSDERTVYLTEALRGLNVGQTSWNGYQHNALFLNIGRHEYVDVAYLMGVAHQTDCRAVVATDLNADGRVDLLLTEAIWDGSPNRMRHQLLIHLNRIENSHHWIGMNLGAGAQAGLTVGAAVTLRTPGQTRRSQVVTGDSFQAQHPPTVHYGLGNASRVEELRIVWPNQRTDTLVAPALDQYHTGIR